MSYIVYNDNCFEWLKKAEPNSITAVITDPPYGVKEYTEVEIDKLREGHGGVWRIPPAFDGHKRAPLPRFSVINEDPKLTKEVFDFFSKWSQLIYKVIVPGGHLFIASTPLLADIVSYAIRQSGFERRGEIIRTVVTFRGGDRPKGAEEEFKHLSVIPRGLFEPWLLFRKPISEKTVAENLRKWNAGALRREEKDIPFSDIIESTKTPKSERDISKHPSLKPQAFLRKLVFAALPMEKGVILDTFSGSGSTLAASEFYNYDSIGIECDPEFYNQSLVSIPKLSKLYPKIPQLPF